MSAEDRIILKEVAEEINTIKENSKKFTNEFDNTSLNLAKLSIQ